MNPFYNKLNKVINKHAPHYPNAKLNSCQNHGLPNGLQNLLDLLGLGMSISFLVLEISIN